MIRSALTASLRAFLPGLMSMIGLLLMGLSPHGHTGAVMGMGSLPGIAPSFVALTLPTDELPNWLFLHRGVLFLRLALNCFPWIFLLGVITMVGPGPGEQGQGSPPELTNADRRPTTEDELLNFEGSP